MKKIISLTLVLLMCLSVLASCNTASSPESSSTPPQSSSEPESSANGIGVEMPTPQNLDREMSIFVGELHYEEWLDKDDGDILNTELYHRVTRVEKNLGIELTTNRIPGTGGFRDQVYTEVVKYCESTDPNMKADLCSTYSWWAGSLALEGRYMNIAASDNIDFEKPYWPEDIINGLSMEGKIYNVSGDISPTLLWETYCILFNVKLIEQFNVDNPIDLVNKNEWTLDKVIELTKNVYVDENKETVGPSIGDIFGLTFSDSAHIKAFPFALGLRVLETDDDNGYALSELYSGEKADGIVTKIRNWINDNDGIAVGGMTPGMGYGGSFIKDQALFNVGNFAFTKYYLTGTGVEFGVVPCPKFEKNQDSYYSYYGNPSAFWGVPCNVESLDDSCALLESLAADAYINISPVLFERALKHKYTPNDASGQSRMFDIIRDGLVFDPCMLYNETLTKYQRWEEIVNNTGAWSNYFNGFSILAWNRQIETIVEKLRALPY